MTKVTKMNKYSKIILSSAVIIASLAVPFVGLAISGDIPNQVTPPTTPPPVSNVSGVISWLQQILSWFAIIFWIFAAGAIFYAAFLYLTAAGNDTKVKKAHSVK